MKILAIETSCDDTSVAIMDCDEKNWAIKTLSNVVSSQIAIHTKWGGVVPNLAAREHLKNLIPVLSEALEKSNQTINEIDLIAVTEGPGLIPALLIGTNGAKALAYTKNIALLGVHHVEGHLYANIINNDISQMKFPVLALTVSGGHTQIILMKDHLNYEIIGQTQDDAAGEAFDKVAKMLQLGYPGGPIVSEYAAKFDDAINSLKDSELKEELTCIKFPRPMLASGDFNFSFSGLKTSVLYFIRKIEQKNLSKEILELYKIAICYEFQNAAVDVLAKKMSKATEKLEPKTVIMAGGVSANSTLQNSLKNEISKKYPSINFINPTIKLCGDNAAMIGAAAFVKYQKLKEEGSLKTLKANWKKLEANSNLKLESY